MVCVKLSTPGHAICPCSLSHRGLLMFAEAQPLDECGLWWLKIHLANLYGYNKGNFDRRVKFAMDHLKDIYDSAENPLDVCPLLLYTMVPFLLMC